MFLKIYLINLSVLTYQLNCQPFKTNLIDKGLNQLDSNHSNHKLIEPSINKNSFVNKFLNDTKSIEIDKLDKELEELKQQSNLDNEKDNKLKRTKRRGARIGGKSSSSGIGHGRTGARQDASNNHSNLPKPFLLYYLILFFIFSITIIFNHKF